MARPSSISRLPPEIRDWLEKSLAENNFSGYAEIADAMRELGYDLSRSAIHRHGQKIERQMAAIRASTQAARQIVASAADDDDNRSEAVIAMVQSGLFDCMMELGAASDPDIEPAERIALFSSAAKNIATLSRASVNQKRHRLELQARAEAAAANIERIATAGGLTAEAVSAMRREVLGMVQ